MALKSGLSVWCYTAPGQGYYQSAVVDYSKFVESLKFTTVAPGGFGQLTCKLNAVSSRIPRPELALFSRVAVIAPVAFSPNGQSTAVFLGELTQPELSGDANGEYWNLQALGVGNCLRDDPRNINYVTQTAQQIAVAEMIANHRNAWMPLSTDQSQVFPDNPAASLTVSYMGYSMEDIFNDLCLESGDYQWGVWGHATQVDGTGFPLGQIFIHLRNSTVVNYQAYISSHDVFSWRITPAADRAYNSMQIYYTDATNNNNYGSVTSTDSRLTATLTQGNAPFRYRKYLQDFSGTSTIGATQASSIEATQLGIMQNVTNKTQMVLRNVRNASGASIPLWAPQADNCIDVPELAQRQQAIATLPTAGTNLFYILNTEYAEDSSGNQSLTLQCDNWYDYAQTRIARLEAKAYQKTMNGSTTAPVQALGSPEFGNCGFQAYCASAGASFGQFFNYRMMLASAPTSITLTSGVTTNANSVAASSLGTAGFFFGWTAPAIGTTEVTRHYLTVGNTLLAVDLEAGTFDHHCDGCDTTRRGLAIAEHLRIAQPRPEVRPEDYSLSIDCPTCGMIECLNTELPEADEIEHERNSAHRATMVKRIRALQTHKHVQQTLQQALNSGKGVN